MDIFCLGMDGVVTGVVMEEQYPEQGNNHRETQR